jgi:hypothetical protein
LLSVVTSESSPTNPSDLKSWGIVWG